MSEETLPNGLRLLSDASRDGTYIGLSIEYERPGQEILIRGKVWLDTDPRHPELVVELYAPDSDLSLRFRGLVSADEG